MKLKLMLIKYGIKQREIAQELGLSRQTVTNRINGKKGEWTESDILKIWEYFKNHVDQNISITDLFF